MGFDQKLKHLLKLQTTQPDAFTAELDEPWPGMRSDIELALGITGFLPSERRRKPNADASTTCFGLSEGFGPIRRPLFYGIRLCSIFLLILVSS